MAITTRKKRVLAEAKDFPGSTTHFPNDMIKEAEAWETEVLNQQDWQDLLIDPDEGPGSTHFRNDMTSDEEGAHTNREVKAAAGSKGKPARTKATSAASKRVNSILANFDIAEDEATGYTQEHLENEPDENATFESGGEDSGVNIAAAKPKKGAKHLRKAFSEEGHPGPMADTHSPVGTETDPTDGYLTVGEMEEHEDEEFEDEDEINADSLGEFDGQNPQQSLLDVTEEHELTADFDGFEGPEDEEFEDEEEEEEEVKSNVDDMAIVDVDSMDDEGDDVAFATLGTTLHVIKGNRIIASMGKKQAVRAGVGDHYLSDEFQEATYVEMSKHGLRAGLAKQKLAMATINVAKNEIVNSRVKARAAQLTASVKRSQNAANSALGQCLAIAAVGINRQYFKDTRNELRAALEDELEASGLRNASRLVRRVFASHGIDYAKSILTLANKLVKMPETARNAFAEALDMTSDGEMEDHEDLDDVEASHDGVSDYGQTSSPDFQVESEFDDEEEFVDHFQEQDETPETIMAAVLNPMKKQRVSASSAPVRTSASIAQEFLFGNKKF